MGKNFAKKRHLVDEHFSLEMRMQSRFTLDDPFQFQIFFITEDQNQPVQILETDELDFGDNTLRLERGESVFIKSNAV